jgi:hypothetical protein
MPSRRDCKAPARTFGAPRCLNTMKQILLALAIAAPVAALAQAPKAPRADGPADPPSTIARSMCEALGGAERERCMAEQKAEPSREVEPRERRDGRRCDDLIGPERDACLKKGGSIKAGVGSTRLPR